MTTRQRDHQKTRRENGMCAVEGCEVYTGKAYRCVLHRREHRQKVRMARSGVSRTVTVA